MPIDPAIAMEELLKKTRRFLETYPLRINGDPSGSGISPYWLNNWTPGGGTGEPQRPDTLWKTRRMHDTEAFTLDCQRTPGTPARFLAYSIQMTASNVPITFYTLPPGGPNILVTGRLSGCSFIVDELGPNIIRCAHLQPVGETGVDLHDRLKTAGYTAVFGRNDYDHPNDPTNPVSYDRHVTIVGHRENGRWSIYAQKLDVMNKSSIRKVRRIYPA